MIRLRSQLFILLLAQLLCCVAVAQDPASRFSALSWSADGKYIVVGDTSGSISAWSIEKKSFVWRFDARSKPIVEIYFDSARDAFLAVERGFDIVYLDKRTGTLLQRIIFNFRESDYKTPAELRFANYDDSSGLLVAVGNLGEMAHVIDMRKVPHEPSTYVLTAGKTATISHPPIAPKKDVTETSLRVWIYKGSFDPSVALDLALGNQGDEIPIQFSFCDSKHKVLAITKKGNILGWDISNPSNVVELPAFTRQVTPGSPDGDKDSYYFLGIGCNAQQQAIVTGFSGKYGDVQLWDPHEVVLSDFKIDAGPIISHGEAMQNNGLLVVTNGDAGLTLWDTSSGKLVRKAKVWHEVSDSPYIQTPNVVQFDPSQSNVAFVLDRQIYLWDIQSSTVSCITSQRCPHVYLSIESTQ